MRVYVLLLETRDGVAGSAVTSKTRETAAAATPSSTRTTPSASRRKAVVPASATVSCAAAEGGVAGEAVRCRRPTGRVLKARPFQRRFRRYERNGVTTPDGFPVYESRLVDGLELLRCTTTLIRAKDHEDDPCGARPCRLRW